MFRRIANRPAGCLVVLLGIAAGGADATTTIPLSEERLVAHSLVIVEGTVAAVRSEWNAAQTQIHTIVEIAIDQVIKGDLGGQKTVTFRLLGGTVGNITLHIPDAPVFTQGEETIVFLTPEYETRLHPIAGFNQGKFTIKLDPNTGVKRIEGRGEPRDTFVSGIRRIMRAQGVKEVNREQK